MKYQPKVSIIIPVYNGANYLREAIKSALSQTYKNTEIIVINDGSSDNGATEAIALEFSEKIHYFQKENGGVSSALNIGILNMTGDYFSWLSHDDLYTHDKLESQIKLLNIISNPTKTILYSDYANKVEKTKKTTEINLKNTNPEAFRYRVAIGNDIHGCSMLIPKTAFEKFGLFNEKLRAVQDYDMWFRLSSDYNFIHIPKVLVTGRVHEQQVGVRLKGLALQENIEFRKKCLANLSSHNITSATNKKEWIAFIDIGELFLKRRLYSVATVAIKLGIAKNSHPGLKNTLALALYLSRSVFRGLLTGYYTFLRSELSSLHYKIKALSKTY